MTDFTDITCLKQGAIARITVTRPDRLNAFRNQTADEMHEAIRVCEADPDIRVVVLAGEGRAFGAGYDLSTIEPGEVPALDDVLERHFNPLVRAMRESRLPVVASVNGPCAGAMVGIALAADIVITSVEAYFYEPFVGIALVPDAGNTLFLSRILGRVRASGMMLLGDRISAQTARDWGMVWAVCEQDELAAETDRIAGKLASLAPSAISATKRLIRSATEQDLKDQLDLERDLQGIAGRSPEMKEAIANFFAKRKAQ